VFSMLEQDMIYPLFSCFQITPVNRLELSLYEFYGP